MRLFLSLLLTVLATSAWAAQGGGPGRAIVLVADGEDPAAVAADLGRRHGFQAERVYRHAAPGFAAPLGRAWGAVAGDPRVRSVERDRILSLPDRPGALGPPPGKGPNKDGGGGGSDPAQILPTGIDRVDADLSATAAIDGVDDRVAVEVAVIDTGIDLDHPDLNVVAAKNFTHHRKPADDDNGHGTHVAGTIAALDNGIGVVGVAPGCGLWAIKVLDDQGSGWLSDIIAGVDYVAANADRIAVANMSLGGSGDSTSLHEAIQSAVAAGVVFTVASGNSAADAAGFIPAKYEEVLAVSAIADSDGQGGGAGPSTSYGADDTFATFSNWGSVVDIAAPGVDILSTWAGGGYDTISGTSMASPHVAGIVALYVAVNGRATDATGVAAIMQAVIDLGTPQSDPDGFTDDPDDDSEPLGDAGQVLGSS